MKNAYQSSIFSLNLIFYFVNGIIYKMAEINISQQFYMYFNNT